MARRECVCWTVKITFSFERERKKYTAGGVETISPVSNIPNFLESSCGVPNKTQPEKHDRKTSGRSKKPKTTQSTYRWNRPGERRTSTRTAATWTAKGDVRVDWTVKASRRLAAGGTAGRPTLLLLRKPPRSWNKHLHISSSLFVWTRPTRLGGRSFKIKRVWQTTGAPSRPQPPIEPAEALQIQDSAVFICHVAVTGQRGVGVAEPRRDCESGELNIMSFTK